MQASHCSNEIDVHGDGCARATVPCFKLIVPHSVTALAVEGAYISGGIAMKRSPRTTLAVAASAVIITVLTSGTASADLREDFEALATAP